MAFGICKVYRSPMSGQEMPASLSLRHLLPFLCDPGNQISSGSHLQGPVLLWISLGEVP